MNTTLAAQVRRADTAGQRCAETARAQRTAARTARGDKQASLLEMATRNERNAAIWRAKAAELRQQIAK